MTRSVLRPYAAAFVEYAGPREEVVCLTGDLTASTEVDDFRDAYPDRFYNIGMAEQNMMGIAGGMASGGLVPFVHTFGVFAARRAFDQVAMAIGVPGLRVRLMGFLPGVSTPGGVTHQAIDDVAIMRSVPGMTIVDVGDATEIQTMLPTLTDVDGPVYCRVVRGDVPVLFDTPFELGRARVLSTGSDVALISASITTAEALRAGTALRAAGVGVSHLHVGTIRPLDEDAVLAAVADTTATIVVENHLTHGGLGSVVAELVAERGIGARVVRLGLRDTYAAGGTQPYLLARFGMDARAIVDAAAGLLDLDAPVDLGGDAGIEVGAGDVRRQEAL